MSMIWTHIQFSEDVIDSIQKTDDYSKYERYMKLGTQIKNLNDLLNSQSFKHDNLKGETVHSPESYHLLLKKIKSAKNKPKHVQAFIIGVITHYVLEQKVQPYIKQLNRKINCYEINAKAQIDTLIMKKTYKLNTWKTPVYNEINVGFFIDKFIVKLLSEVKHPFSKNIQKMYWRLNILLRYYFDPYGWKTKLLPSYQPIYKPYLHSQNGIDYLNESHSKWIDITTNEISTKSFSQLYDKAELEATVLLNEIVKYWNSSSNQVNDNIRQLLALTLLTHKNTLSTRSS